MMGSPLQLCEAQDDGLSDVLCGDTNDNFRFDLFIVNSTTLTDERSKFRYAESASATDHGVDHVLTALRGSNRL